jgi:hypothetical protein
MKLKLTDKIKAKRRAVNNESLLLTVTVTETVTITPTFLKGIRSHFAITLYFY